tara:strand:- start:1906 stop:2298 length:393 start_codon:yes stop_codon:yes gene_type:complete
VLVISQTVGVSTILVDHPIIGSSRIPTLACDIEVVIIKGDPYVGLLRRWVPCHWNHLYKISERFVFFIDGLFESPVQHNGFRKPDRTHSCTTPVVSCYGGGEYGGGCPVYDHGSPFVLAFNLDGVDGKRE